MTSRYPGYPGGAPREHGGRKSESDGYGGTKRRATRRTRRASLLLLRFFLTARLRTHLCSMSSRWAVLDSDDDDTVGAAAALPLPAVHRGAAAATAAPVRPPPNAARTMPQLAAPSSAVVPPAKAPAKTKPAPAFAPPPPPTAALIRCATCSFESSFCAVGCEMCGMPFETSSDSITHQSASSSVRYHTDLPPLPPSLPGGSVSRGGDGSASSAGASSDQPAAPTRSSPRAPVEHCINRVCVLRGTAKTHAFFECRSPNGPLHKGDEAGGESSRRVADRAGSCTTPTCIKMGVHLTHATETCRWPICTFASCVERGTASNHTLSQCKVAKGLPTKKERTTQPCTNPVCVAEDRHYSHTWEKCKSAGGPFEIRCTNPACVERNRHRGHTFENCGAPGGARFLRERGDKQLAKKLPSR